MPKSCQQLTRLRRRVRVLEQEREILKSRGLVCQGERLDPVAGFESVNACQAEFPVAAMCRVLAFPVRATTPGWAVPSRPGPPMTPSSARSSSPRLGGLRAPLGRASRRRIEHRPRWRRRRCRASFEALYVPGVLLWQVACGNAEGLLLVAARRRGLWERAAAALR